MTKIPIVDMSDYDKQGCLDDMFKKQANATPNAVAVVNIDGSVVSLIFKTNFKFKIMINIVVLILDHVQRIR